MYFRKKIRIEEKIVKGGKANGEKKRRKERKEKKPNLKFEQNMLHVE